MILFNDFCHRHYTKCLFPNQSSYKIFESLQMPVVDYNAKCLLDLYRCLARSTTTTTTNMIAPDLKIAPSSSQTHLINSDQNIPLSLGGMHFGLWIVIAISTIYIALSLSFVCAYKAIRACRKRKGNFTIISRFLSP